MAIDGSMFLPIILPGILGGLLILVFLICYLPLLFLRNRLQNGKSNKSTLTITGILVVILTVYFFLFDNSSFLNEDFVEFLIRPSLVGLFVGLIGISRYYLSKKTLYFIPYVTAVAVSLFTLFG